MFLRYSQPADIAGIVDSSLDWPKFAFDCLFTLYQSHLVLHAKELDESERHSTISDVRRDLDMVDHLDDDHYSNQVGLFLYGSVELLCQPMRFIFLINRLNRSQQYSPRSRSASHQLKHCLSHQTAKSPPSNDIYSLCRSSMQNSEVTLAA